MKQTFLKTALAALFIAPFAFNSAFAACIADPSKKMACCASETDGCKKCHSKTHKCKKECQCSCCAEKKNSRK